MILRPRLALTAALLAAALSGCATTHRRRRVRTPTAPPVVAAPMAAPMAVASLVFPSRDELAALSAAPPRAAPAAEPTAPLEPWELAGPLPEAVGTRPSTDAAPLAALLRARSAGTDGRVAVTEAMQCVARELGRYLLRHEGRVPPPFADFVLGRCGAMSSVAMTALVRGTAPARGDEAGLVRQLDAQLGAQADSLLRATPGAASAGAALVREGDRFVSLMVAERRAIELTASAPDGDAVTLEGRVLDGAAGVTGYVNQGAAAADCAIDPAVAAPAFRARCPLRAGDGFARVELFARASGRLLGALVFSGVVGPGRASARRFEVPPGDAAPLDPGRATAGIVALLNAARAAGGIAPVALAAAESEAACRLAPVYFGEPSPAGHRDRVALGLMAGWEVSGGMIREGNFFSTLGVTDNSLPRWMAWTLDRPMGRRVLMDPAVRQVAVCPHLVDGRIAGLVWASYSFYEDGPADARAVRARLDAQRRAAGVEPALDLDAVRPVMASAARAAAQGAELGSVLQAMLDRGVPAAGLPLHGWVIPTLDLGTVALPPDLLSARGLRAAIEVVHRREPGAAWGQAVVYVLGYSPSLR